jgi:hypothetical protein
VADGPRDLVGVKSALAGAALTPNSIVIQRDLNLANNASTTLDFATGVAPVSRTTTIANIGTQVAALTAGIITKNFTFATLITDATAPSGTAARTWLGVPDASTVAGDFHQQTAVALTNATTPFPQRSITVYNRLATNSTLTLPNAMTPPTLQVAGTSPYVMINSNWAIESAFNQGWFLTYTPASGSVTNVLISGTPGYFGSGPVQLNIPNFGSSFNAAHGLQPGIQLTWTFAGSGGTSFTQGIAEGATTTQAIVGGTITP